MEKEFTNRMVKDLQTIWAHPNKSSFYVQVDNERIQIWNVTFDPVELLKVTE